MTVNVFTIVRTQISVISRWGKFYKLIYNLKLFKVVSENFTRNFYIITRINIYIYGFCVITKIKIKYVVIHVNVNINFY